jgi:hypothetical protein
MHRTVPLLAINLLPIACIALFGWSAFMLLLLYWAENVVIGAFTLVKMFVAGIAKGPWQILSTVFLCGFFVIHYGLFCIVHGSLIWTLANGAENDPNLKLLPGLLSEPFVDNATLLVSLFLIIAYHLYLFIGFWLWPGRWKQEKLDGIMATPYGRIIVIHITLLVGGFVTVSLGEPFYMVMLLALLKAAMDYGAVIVSNATLSGAVAQSA